MGVQTHFSEKKLNFSGKAAPRITAIFWRTNSGERLLCSLPSGKNFLKKKVFFPLFCGALCLKKKSWAFSFKRAVFWRPSFQRKVFLKKFFARKIAEIF